MEDALLEIIAALKTAASAQDTGTRVLNAAWLDKLVRRYNRATHDATRRVAKRRLLPFYLAVKQTDPGRWAAWDVDPATEQSLLRLLKMKPRRTASGVATVTVITKPWPCSSDCLYCPNDVRMPKSYLANEPACQRAERNYFDPYLQARSRLTALSQMGHVVDKVELIVLGGTWNDYPEDYQVWFVRELFRAVNEFDDGGPGTRELGGREPKLGGPESKSGEHETVGPEPEPVEPEPGDPAEPDAAADRSASAQATAAAHDTPEQRDARYRTEGFVYAAPELQRRTETLQREVDEGCTSYNQAIHQLNQRPEQLRATTWQTATWNELLREHARNERARRRVVGLTVETRPDLITPQSARTLRKLGCTKVQMGIQSLDERILALNGRHVSLAQIESAFRCLRLAGFKIQIHFMANLLGSTPEADKADYLQLVRDPRFLPDEVKLYPCALVGSSRLTEFFECGAWQPYSEAELLDLLCADVLATPAYTRISRVIRDISATDILAGNKKTNLRQMVDGEIAARGSEPQEIRQREVATSDVSANTLVLDCVRYTTTVSEERFLQWVTPEGRIAGFLRLSLPTAAVSATAEAMIREVHVYGRVAALHDSEAGGAQHSGLGHALVEEACKQARAAGYHAIYVISSVGTREYYRSLGFVDGELYQRREL